MKIKFIKEYVSVDPATKSGIIHRFGETEEIEDYTAQWLIDNGFAEEFKESGWWKPKLHGKYYFLSNVGEVMDEPWLDSGVDESRYSVGNCFKTEDAAERYKEYLKAITIVRQDEGVIDLQTVRERCEAGSEDDDFCAYTIAYGLYTRRLTIMGFVDCISASATWFDTEEHAEASIDKHQDEWKTILNYDWSKE